jgi:hypothetical protein
METLRPRSIALIYLVLLAIAIPWYWPATDARHLFGLPLWAWASLAAVMAMSVFTAWVFSRMPYDDRPHE